MVFYGCPVRELEGCEGKYNWYLLLYHYGLTVYTQQEDVLSLGDFIGKFSRYNDIPRIFSEIAETTRQKKKVYFRLKVSSERNRGKYLSITQEGGQIGKIALFLTFLDGTTG
jgi:hypothetical protein